MDVSDLARHSAPRRRLRGLPRARLQRPHDRHAGGARPLPARGLDDILASAAALAERYSAALADDRAPRAAVRARLRASARGSPTPCACGPARRSDRDRADAPACCATAWRPGAGSWRSTRGGLRGRPIRLCATPRRRDRDVLMLPLFPDLTERGAGLRASTDSRPRPRPRRVSIRCRAGAADAPSLDSPMSTRSIDRAESPAARVASTRPQSRVDGRRAAGARRRRCGRPAGPAVAAARADRGGDPARLARARRCSASGGSDATWSRSPSTSSARCTTAPAHETHREFVLELITGRRRTREAGDRPLFKLAGDDARHAPRPPPAQVEPRRAAAAVERAARRDVARRPAPADPVRGRALPGALVRRASPSSRASPASGRSAAGPS